MVSSTICSSPSTDRPSSEPVAYCRAGDRGLHEAQGADRQRQGADVGAGQVRDGDGDEQQPEEAPFVEPQVGGVGGVGEREQPGDQEADLREHQRPVQAQARYPLADAGEPEGDQGECDEQRDADRQPRPAADARQVLAHRLEVLEESSRRA